MLKFKVDGQNIVLADKTPLGFPMVSGTIGEYDCQFEFDESWNGYGKTAYFMNIGGRSCIGKKTEKVIPIPLDMNNQCKVPVEVLKPKTFVRIGVGGVKEKNTKPTIYSSPFFVRLGANADIPCPETDTYEHIIQIVEETKEIAQSVRNDAEEGKFNGKDGASPDVIVERVADGAKLTVTDAKGTTEAIIKDGAIGTFPSEGKNGQILTKIGPGEREVAWGNPKIYWG